MQAKSRLQRQRELAEAFGAGDDTAPVAPPVKKVKLGEAQAFFEELKRKHDGEGDGATGTSTSSNSNSSSSSSSSSSTTTKQEREMAPDDGYIYGSNLYVAPLHPLVTEERLYELFRPYGALNSIKVMWPRTDIERQRGRNIGFVSFMEAADAIVAKQAMTGVSLEGMRLDLEWGKAVRRCAVPYTPATAATSSQCFRPSLPSMTNEALAGPTHAAAAAVPLLPVMGTAPEGTSNAPLIVISPPTVNCSLLFGGGGGDGLRPDVLQRVIDLTAKFVAVDGAALEKVIQRREGVWRDAVASSSFPPSYFGFLLDYTLPEHQYYRWRTYTHVVADAGRGGGGWSTDPFRLSPGGSLIVPPPHGPRCEDEDDEEDEDDDKEDVGGPDVVATAHAGPCYDFQRSGSCLYGDRCRFSHTAHGDSIKESATMGKDMDGGKGKSRGRGKGKSKDKSKDMGPKSRGLPAADRATWQTTVAGLSSSRTKIRAAMGWALDRVEHATELACILLAGMTPPSVGLAPPPSATDASARRMRSALQASTGALLARLFLASDLLFNCSLPLTHVSIFRAAFQEHLPLVFDLLGGRLRAQGRLSARTLSDAVLAVLQAWEEWSLFPREFLLGLEAALLVPESEAKRFAAIEGSPTAFRECVDTNPAPAGAAAGGGAAAAAAVEEVLADQGLQRRARMCGVDPSGSAAFLLARVGYAEAYVRLRGGGASAGPVAGEHGEGGLQVQGAGGEDGLDGVPITEPADDIDGAPLDWDDVDGVPLW